MPELGRFSRELRGRFWKPSVEDEVRAEFASHIQMLEQDLIAGGMKPDEASRLARERFGDPALVSAECIELGTLRDRHSWWTRFLSEWRQDVGYALRQLRGSPRFAIVAILTLAVGLGASTTIFAIASTVLLRPLPFHDPSRLVLVDEVNPHGQGFAISEPNFLDLSERARTVSGLAAFAPRSLSIIGDGAPERLRGIAASHSIFSVLGATPQLGRVFAEAEDQPGGDIGVVVLSDSFWRRRFGADPEILGRSIDLDGVRRTVIGVMQPGFEFPGRTDIWVPLAADPASLRGDRRLEAVARLAPGATPKQAGREVATIAAELAAEYPVSNGAWTAQVRPFSEWYVTPRLKTRVIALLGTVGLLVLMACVNVASLLLARAGTRGREIAVRAALGAGRSRIVRQLLTESLLLAVIGGVLGVALALAATPLIRSVGGTVVPLLATMSMDWRMMAFAFAACAITGIVFGLAPALVVAGRSPNGTMHDLLRSGSRVASGGRLRGTLIVASVAMATVMLVCASLVGASFVKLMRTDLGFERDHVLTASIVLPDSRYDFDRSATFFGELMPRLAQIPGVQAAGAVNLAPFSGGNTGMDFVPGSSTPVNPGDYLGASWRAVTTGYFAVLGIPLQRGRLFDRRDDGGSQSVMVINETMARLGWPDSDPIGREVTLSNTRTMTIVGIVGDTRNLSIDSPPVPEMYFAHSQFPWMTMWLTIRTSGDPMSAVSAVRREVQAIDPNIALARVQPLERLVRDVAAEPRLTMLIFSIFASAALILAAAGLYGLVSYTVAQRTREIGVRLALGATPGSVARAVMGRGIALATSGIALGVVLAYGVTKSLNALLYHTEPTDPLTLVAVVLLLLFTAALASLAPARRAARLEPVVALRAE